MVFVRIKRIYGSEYAYLVANSWTGSGPRQKVSKYLGKVIRPEKAKSEGLQAFLGLTTEKDLGQWIGKSSFKDAVSALIKLELSNHAITYSSGGNKGTAAPLSTLSNSSQNLSLKLNAEKAEFLDDKGKGIVIALNNGFLCSYTAKKLLEYDAAADYSGYNLADLLTAVGMAVEKDVFISLFGKAQAAPMSKQETAEEKAFKDFYY